MNTMTKKWGVTLPIAGSIYVEVEADTEDDAIEAALSCDVSSSDINDWDMMKAITRGNVCYARVHKAYAQIIEDEDAER